MQTVDAPKSSGKIALMQGLIFGVSVGIVLVLLSALSNFVNLGTGGILVSILGFLLEIAAYFFAGWRAAQQTGKVSTGTLAGLWTGLFAAIISITTSLIFFYTGGLERALQRTPSTASLSQDTLRQVLVFAEIGGVVFGLLFGLGIGAGVGALGGLVGRKRSNVPTETYQQPY